MNTLQNCDRLKKIDLSTLYYIILIADIIQMYRILNRIDKLELSNNYVDFNTWSSRHNSVGLIKPRALITIQQNSLPSTTCLSSGVLITSHVLLSDNETYLIFIACFPLKASGEEIDSV